MSFLSVLGTRSSAALIVIFYMLFHASSTQELVFRNTNFADEILRTTFGLSPLGINTRISSVDSSSSSSPTEAGCVTPNHHPGLCVLVSQCPLYIPLVQDIRKPEVFNFFKTHICRLEITSVRICCVLNNEAANLPTAAQSFQAENPRPGSLGFVQTPPSVQGTQPQINFGGSPSFGQRPTAALPVVPPAAIPVQPSNFGESPSFNPSQNLPVVPSHAQPSQTTFQSHPFPTTTSVPTPNFFEALGQRPTTALPVVPPAAIPVQPSRNLHVGPLGIITTSQPDIGVSFSPDRQSDQEPQGTPTESPQPLNGIIPTERECGSASFVARNNQSPTWPWLAAVGTKLEGNTFSVTCGGALITRRHVISAAHCFSRGKFGTPTHVRLGDYDLARSNDLASPRDVQIKNVQTPGFDSNSFEKDIAIITLSQDMDFDEFIQPVCLPYRFLYDGFRYQSLGITGWSRTVNSKGRENIPQTHQGFEAAVVGLDDCRSTYRDSSSLTIDRRNICAAGNIREACLSDIGAPAVYLDDATGRYYLIGVVSFGFGCDRPESPVVYSRIGAFLAWVEQSVQ